MATEAKVPTDATDWQAIDIFVFTNGQQFSPPRKYHLNSQELNWWKSILNFLARSQYGSLHSIDLYTVSGEKIEGPLQLSNGAAYVAVKTPDPFIDTGSWEKSQARRSNSIEITKHDECNVITVISNNSLFKNKIEEEIITCDIVDEVVVPESKVKDKPQAVLNVQEKPQRDSNAIYRQSDKRRISPIQRSSILRKPIAPPSSTKKESEKKTKDVQRNSKGSLKVNDKTTLGNGGNDTKAKVPPKTPKRISVLKEENGHSENKEASIVSGCSDTNTLNIDQTPNELRDDPDDLLLVANIFKSTDSEIPSMVVPFSAYRAPDVTEHETLNNITEESTTNETKITADVDKNAPKIELFTNTRTDLNSEKDLNNQNTLNQLQISQLQKNPNVSFKDNPDNNYVVISNGDIVNLKLHIEVRNEARLVNKTSKTDRKSKSYTDIDKTEKGSQINLDTEMAVQNKSLQSIFVSDFKENFAVREDPGAVVIKCTCCQEKNQSISKMNAECSINDSKVYVIVLPSPGLDKTFERCQCGNKVMDIDYTDNLQTNRPSIINPIRKVSSNMALEILNSIGRTSDISRAEKPNLSCSDKNTAVPTVAECVTVESDTKHHVAIVENEMLCTKDVDKNNFKTICSDNQLVANANTKTLAKCTTTSATQTELCCLLLEARLHEDGRYSFHLPPLDILKHYKL